MQLAGRRILVTGASSGIGRAVAERVRDPDGSTLERFTPPER